jgi:hypothetical protein
MLSANFLEVFALVIITYFLANFFQGVSAISPSFVHQELEGPTNEKILVSIIWLFFCVYYYYVLSKQSYAKASLNIE